MSKTGNKLFLLLFVLIPLLVGGYSILFNEIKHISSNDDGRIVIECLSTNVQEENEDTLYKPIETTFNVNRIGRTNIDPLNEYVNTIDYDLRNHLENIVSEKIPITNSSELIIEPFKGLLEHDFLIDQTMEEQGLKSSYVFPPDDRQKVTATSSYPWRTICKLYIEAQNGSRYIASGTIIDNFHVLTAGHCVYIHDAGGWVNEIRVVPGMNDNYAPYGYAYATNMRSYTGWTLSEMVEHDWAVITLDRSLGLLTGWLGRQTADPSNSIYTGTLHTAGYPGDLDYGESMYYVTDQGDRANEYNHWFWMDSAGGQSGSSVWRFDGTNRYILSILAYEYKDGSDANFGTRLNTDKFDQINSWLATDSTTPPDDKADLLDRDYFSDISATELVKGETTLEIYCDVKNEGTAAASSFDVSFYVSDDSFISSTDYLVGSIIINSLNPYNYAASDWSGKIPVTIPDGSYYVGWIIDSNNDVQEFDESNNVVLLSYSKVEIKSSPLNFWGIALTIFLVLGIISLVSIVLIRTIKRIPDLRFDEKSYYLFEDRPTEQSSQIFRENSPETLDFNFCSNCGYKQMKGSIFCPNCGYKLR